MDTTIEYDTVKTLVANPPNLDPRPNFFNLRELRLHFARALKKIPCPQSGVNGWSGAVMSPKMYALIDGTPFHLNIAPATDVADFPPLFAADGITSIPYKREETIKINATFKRNKNYNDTWLNIYRAVYDALDAHVNDAYKVAPTTNLLFHGIRDHGRIIRSAYIPANRGYILHTTYIIFTVNIIKKHL